MGWKGIVIGKSEFVAKTQFTSFYMPNIYTYNFETNIILRNYCFPPIICLFTLSIKWHENVQHIYPGGGGSPDTPSETDNLLDSIWKKYPWKYIKIRKNLLNKIRSVLFVHFREFCSKKISLETLIEMKVELNFHLTKNRVDLHHIWSIL